MELLIVLSLVGTLCVLSIKLLVKTKSEPWPRVMDDYATHLGTVYNQILLQTGNVPVLASNGLPGYLATWESIATYTSSSPSNLAYPSRIVVYLYPEQVAGISNPVLSGTNNREWMLVDMNGSNGPNVLTSGGDQVLLYIENTTGRILTSCQKKAELGQSGTQSFYDVARGYTCP